MNKRTQGFTLLELMITVAILGIIAAIAFPSYQQYVLRSNRTEGQAMLSDAVARQERYYAQNNSYVASQTNIGKLQLRNTTGTTVKSDTGLYSLTVAATAGNGGYIFTATPQGSQTRDTACANLTLNALGTKGKSGTASTAAECWR
ncbi:MAG: type IV pilin protein [Pseudomonas sp.]